MFNEPVLIIAYWFPPAGGIAVQRALSLARYLPEHGFQVHVLTPSNPPSPVLDPALLNRVPPEVAIHRAWTPMPKSLVRKRIWSLISRRRKQPSGWQRSQSGASRVSNLVRRLVCPDPEVLWVPFALRRARRIVKRYGIKTVLVTAPPFSAFLIGNALKQEFSFVRLISDFRDEWLRFFLSTFEFQQGSYIRRRAEAIERVTVEQSDAVVTVASSLVDELRHRYSDVPANKFVCIPNGYDPALFADFRPRSHQSTKLIVTYVGTVYVTSSPDCYFAALEQLPESLRERIETRFIGRIADDEQPLLDSRPDVKVLGYLPQAEALRRIEETDFLLLVMKDPTGVTGKIYEYLATGKPIIAFSPRGGEVDRLLKETGGGWCLDPNDGHGIAAFFERLTSGDLRYAFRPNPETIRRYERTRLVGDFATLIQRISVPESAVAKLAGA